MKLFVAATVAAFLMVTFQAQAKKPSPEKVRESLTHIVPDGKVVQEDGDEYKVSTSKSTVIEVEFNRDGTIDDASGDAAEAGDVFVPGNKMITLAQAVEAVKKAGKNPAGDWSYKKSFMHGWVYEIEGFENNKKMEYLVSAKDGSLIKSKKD